MDSFIKALSEFDINQYDYSGPWLYYAIGLYFSLPVLAYIVLPFIFPQSNSSGTRSVTIFVLGDLGHSPRMCYHARSFANLEYDVNLCGYIESELPDDLIDHEAIDIFDIPVYRNKANLPFILFAVQKIVLQVFSLFKMLFSFRYTNYILVQNPPSIPILFLVIVFVKVFSRNTKIIVDWHNLNYSILNLRYDNEKHPMVRCLKTYEKILGKFADLNLTVTKSMKDFLVDEFGIDKSKVTVLYDRPGDNFAPLTKLEFTKSEIQSHEIFKDIDMSIGYKILISSTSFTPDEDFNVLLDALKLYDQDSQNKQPILLLVTGKGPLKPQFLAQVRENKYSDKVVIKSVWLLIEDYPVIMSIADIGISLHTSSSGLDLPMKILDFFGCGIPVISLTFSSIGELVKDGVNGLITKDNGSQELYRMIKLALTDEKVYDTIKTGASRESEHRWRQNWNEHLGNFFNYR